MRIHLAKELDALGYEGHPADFRDTVRECHANLTPSWTDEELLYHPKDALRLCKVVREQTGLKELEDHVILRTLINFRKRQPA